MDKISDLTSATICQNAGIRSNWEYREFMQKNGKQIMKVDTREYFNASGNNAFYTSSEPNREFNAGTKPDAVNTNVPFLFNHTYDIRVPAIGNETSDLKQDFLKKERIKSRMVAPTMFISKK